MDYKYETGALVGLRYITSRSIVACRILEPSFIGSDPAYKVQLLERDREVMYVGEDDLISGGDLLARRLRG